MMPINTSNLFKERMIVQEHLA